jgi:hypothetical protein
MPVDLTQNTGGPDILPALPGRKTGGAEASRIYRGTYRQGQAFQDILPSLMSTLFSSINSQAGPQAAQQLALLQQYGQQFAQAEGAAGAAGQKAKAEGDLNLLNTTGRDITNSTTDLARLADPEFFALREKLGAKAGALLDSQDPTKLSGSEAAEIERGVNRNNVNRGVANSGSVINTVKSGMMFGNALADKQARLGQTLNSIASFAPNLKGGTFNYGAATGQAGAGAGLGEFSSSTGNASNLGSSLASNLMGQTGAGGQAQLGSATTKSANRVTGTERILGALPDY